MNKLIIINMVAATNPADPSYMEALYFVTGLIAMIFTLMLGVKLFVAIHKWIHREKKPKQIPAQSSDIKPDGRKHRTIHTINIKPREVPITAFVHMRQRTMKRYIRPTTRRAQSFAGVYILYNRTQRKHYVGQSIDVINRVHQHFNGQGNQDLYADYMMGEDFTIYLVELSETKFTNLNDLERHLIHDYDAYYNGYNKTRGNKSS